MNKLLHQEMIEYVKNVTNNDELDEDDTLSSSSDL